MLAIFFSPAACLILVHHEAAPRLKSNRWTKAPLECQNPSSSCEDLMPEPEQAWQRGAAGPEHCGRTTPRLLRQGTVCSKFLEAAARRGIL